MDGGDDSRYVHDTTTVKTVNVAAIYGRVEAEPHNTTVSCDGMLEAFTDGGPIQ